MSDSMVKQVKTPHLKELKSCMATNFKSVLNTKLVMQNNYRIPYRIRSDANISKKLSKI